MELMSYRKVAKKLSSRLIGRGGLSRFLQCRLNSFLIRWLPFALGRAYLILFGRVFYFLNRKEKQEITGNLTAVIQWLFGKVSMDPIIHHTFRGIFAHYHEKIFSAYGGLNRVCNFIRKQVHAPDLYLLDEALSRGKGLILVTGHFGGVEFLPTILALNGYKVTMVVRFKTERLKRTLNKHTERVGITLLDAGEGESIIFKALQALKRNQILITECDEFKAWHRCQTRKTLFLGCPSSLDRTLDLLQNRYNSPAVMGLVQREKDNRYQLKLHSLNGSHQDSEDTSLSQRALQILEYYIRLAPDQWYQWNQLRVILDTRLFEERRPIHATQADRSLPLADSAPYAC